MRFDRRYAYRSAASPLKNTMAAATSQSCDGRKADEVQEARSSPFADRLNLAVAYFAKGRQAIQGWELRLRSGSACSKIAAFNKLIAFC